jgi:membrane protein
LTIAIIGAIWTASSIFEALRTILNRAYRVTSAPGYIFRRLISIVEFLVAVTLAVAFLLALIMIPNIIYFYKKFISSYIPLNLALFITPEAEKIRFIILMLVILLLVALTYYALPNRKHKLSNAFPGSFLVVFGWYIFSLLFKYYINNVPQVNLIYGSIAGVIIALLYFYFCSIILIVGAEFNYQIEHVFYKRRKK